MFSIIAIVVVLLAPFMTKLMGVFVSMDSMVGKDFEKGLANLKAISEN